ncbi:SMI1/KNR4 family protein [Actinospica robiniae]|uniref:SMI1/KNR4 family protein n=1 Tax=Actinospica robiniae TaxID=304901 RepID=UPI0003FB083C|nr:SMI1/KNR4 family protein [Actinospica robiniae]
MNDDELVAALRADAVRSGNLQPSATQDALAEAERIIGLPIPTLLRRLYLEVGNGGFGPDLMGVRGGFPSANFDDIADLYQDGPDPDGVIPDGLVLVYDWGCSIWSMVDFRDPVGPVWRAESGALSQETTTLAQWLNSFIEESD